MPHRKEPPAGELQLKEALQLNDTLALHRTRLANERTLLAYARLALTLLIAGFTLIRFFEHHAYVWAGALLLPCAPLVLGVGYYRYRQVLRRLQRDEQQHLARGRTRG